jgi:RNA polymerase sigma factor for flagellar operon FliA
MRALRSYADHQHAERNPTTERRALVERHASMVRRVASRIFRRLPRDQHGIEFEDLVSAGVLGLLEAHQCFEQRDGYTFATFAEFRVKGAILDELRRRDFFPRRLRAKANRIRKAREKLERELNRDPLDQELARELDMEVEEFRDLERETAPYRFLDAEDASLSLEAKEVDPAKMSERADMRSQLVKALHKLPERDQLVLDLYFNEELTLREIAETFELSIGRVSQIKTAAIERLRTMLADA